MERPPQFLLTAATTLLAASVCALQAGAQFAPVAKRPIEVSAFGGLTAADTGLNHNLAITAGADIGVRFPVLPFYPSLEVRGTYPISGGAAAITQRSDLAGLRLSRFYGRFEPYVDVLAGRNQTNYKYGYVAPSGRIYYVQSVSTVYSPGAGLNLRLDRRLALRLDAQFQYYDSPVVASGHLFAETFTAAAEYRFNFERHPL